MPREGTEYHVDSNWRTRVQERLLEMKQNQSWLAAESGCPRSMLSELLSGKRGGSTYLPEIHKVLGWSPPLGPLLSKDDEEMLHLTRGLDSDQRARLLERAQILREEKTRR